MITDAQRSALESALSKLRATAIDEDILDALAPSDLDSQNPEVVAKNMLDNHPHCFKVEKGWAEIEDPEEFNARDRAFRQSLAQEPEPSENEFRSLDCALLGAEEETALRKYLGGRASKFEISILRAALASQQKLLGGAA